MSYIENEIIPAYRFDKHGHFFQISGAQIVKQKDGTLGPAVPPDCVLFAPEGKEGYWYVINEEKTEWTAVKKPTTAEECLGIVITHEDQCEYAHEVRKLFEELTKDSTEYRIHRDEETLAQSVEKIPEKTFEEVKAEKERELSSKASAFEQTVCKSMVIKSSIGYLMDADKRSQENIQGVLTIMQDAKNGLSGAFRLGAYGVFRNSIVMEFDTSTVQGYGSVGEHSCICFHERKFQGAAWCTA